MRRVPHLDFSARDLGVSPAEVICQDLAVRDWPGRAHVETLRAWPELARLVAAVDEQAASFAGGILIGSFSRGGGDALSDIDFIAVTHPQEWEAAWADRDKLSAGALVTFDRFEEGVVGVGGHSWLTSDLIKVEVLIAEPGAMRIAGDAAVLSGADGLLSQFGTTRAFTREQIKQYANDLRETGALDAVEQAYDNLVAVLRSEVLPRASTPSE